MNQRSPVESASPTVSVRKRLRTLVIGKARDPLAPAVFHKVSLIAFLAWIGLGVPRRHKLDRKA